MWLPSRELRFNRRHEHNICRYASRELVDGDDVQFSANSIIWRGLGFGLHCHRSGIRRRGDGEYATSDTAGLVSCSVFAATPLSDGLCNPIAR